MRPVGGGDSHDELVEQVRSARWYHAMELPGGIVTPGDYDLPDALRRIPFPASLAGKRCLDVGTRDGFFAFEMERRGASEVVAIDLADPSRLDFPGLPPDLGAATKAGLDKRASAFGIAHRALGSEVQWRDLSVYDLDPDEVGRFDFAFIGTLLLHLRNPVDALKAIRGVLATDGQLMSNDPISIPLSVLRPITPAAEVVMQAPRPFWWVPNVAGRKRMVEAAGYDIVSSGRPYLMRYGSGWTHARLSGGLGMRVQGLVLRRGAPHTWIVARPAG